MTACQLFSTGDFSCLAAATANPTPRPPPKKPQPKPTPKTKQTKPPQRLRAAERYLQTVGKDKGKLASSGVLIKVRWGVFTSCFEGELVVRLDCHMEKLVQKLHAR